MKDYTIDDKSFLEKIKKEEDRYIKYLQELYNTKEEPPYNIKTIKEERH